MKTLPLIVSKWWGCNWTQLKREGLLAIYHQVGIDKPTNRNRGANNYCVIIVRERKEQKLFKTPAKESIPSGSEWGNYGWTYKDLESAERKFAALLAEGKHQKD